MDLHAFWSGATQGMNWVLGLGLLALAWLVGRLGAVAGRRTEAAMDRWWVRGVEAWRSFIRDRKRRKADRAEASRLAVIEQDRMGKRFRFRATRDDPGMVGEVVRVDPGDPERRVIVVWSSPPTRPRLDCDIYRDGQPVSMEWKHLMMSPAGQLHWTARVLARSSSDHDGWVQFVPITD